MKCKLFTLMTVAFMSFLLGSCSYFNKENTKTALCNRIKADLMFNGTTNITRKSNIENAEKQRLQQSYNDNHC